LARPARARFSDGKLTTGISYPGGGFVLTTLYEHGAPEEISQPRQAHNGTDRLPGSGENPSGRKSCAWGARLLFLNAALADLALEDGHIGAARLERGQSGVGERLRKRPSGGGPQRPGHLRGPVRPLGVAHARQAFFHRRAH
jgi:hypothetical protein